MKIDQLVPPDTVHQYDDQAVLRAAHETGCLITECCMCPDDRKRYLANGEWVEPGTEEMKEGLRGERYMSDTWCPECEEKFRQMYPRHFSSKN